MVDRIGPYRLEGRLGQGGMGEVFLAFDERLERRVAVKRIRWQPGTPPGAAERFRREAKAVARLNHPAIVQVYDLVTDASGDAIVMEHVAGRPLASLLQGTAVPPALAVRWAREVAEGLAHAHGAGFVHRDLKAENVMVTGSGAAKILDFGLARPLAPDAFEGSGDGSLTAEGAVVGTVHAMSPEQAGGGPVDARSDLFSLGSLLYEMLTGRAPFRGGSPLESLRRVLTEEPPPLATVRPDLPAALCALVHHLMSKSPDARPPGAQEVARRLAEMEALPELHTATALPLPWSSGMSGLPTEATPAGGPPPARSRDRRRGALAAAVGVALLCAAGLAGWLAWHGRRTGEAVPLLRRVLVQPPQVPAGAPDPRLALAASGVLDATLASLAGLQGIAVLDPRQLASQGTADAAPAALARSVAADEVLSASVRPAGNLARVTLRRLAGGESRLLWTSTFQVAANPDDLRLLSEAVGVHVQRGFPEHPPRPGLPVLEVRDEDYAAYLALKQSLDAGHTPAGPELAAVEAIVRGSPRFLAGLLLAGELARSLFLSTQEARYLDRAQDLARRAEALAPGDPRPPVLSFRLAVLGGRAGEPEAALARLEAALPGDPQVFSYRAELAEARGRAGEALRHMQAAAQRIPSWRNLYDLAGLELRSGRMPEARRHLRTLLERSPGNLWGTEALAQLELRHGDPHQAGLLFAELATREPPQRSLWTNLGLARFLAGDPEGAAAAYRKALEIEPGHSVVLLNLADAELARGRRQSAEALYRQTLSRLAALEARSTLQAADRMAKAQCLAHLGRAVEAAEIAQRTLQQSPDAPDAVYAAALVYALVGDRTSALLNAKAALRLGMSPSWFRISAFDSLRGDPELQGLLRAGALSG